MGTLFLPSLKEKKFFEINNVSLEDAQEMVNEFTEKVKLNHKTKDTGSAASNLIVYDNIIDTSNNGDGVDEFDLFHLLGVADTRGTRGARAIFVDDDTNTFAVGTTVVYNRNWATLNFDDQTVLDKLRTEYELTIDKNLNDDDDKSWWTNTLALG